MTIRAAFGVILAASLLLGCAPRGPLFAPSPAASNGGAETLPPEPTATTTPLPYEIEDAIAFREELGLRADPEYVIAVANDPRATTDLLAIPLLPEEEEEISRRFGAADRAATVFSAYGREHADEFGGLYLDSGSRVMVLLFTRNLEEHEREVRALAPAGIEVVVREVRYTQTELLAVQEELTGRYEELLAGGVEIMTVGLDTQENQVTVDAKSDDPNAEAALEALYPGMVDATVHPFPGPWSHVEAGDGWRLLAAGETDHNAAYTVDAATDAAAAESLWERAGLEGSLPAVDWEREIVVAFVEGLSQSCPELRLDDVVIDPPGREVYSVTSDPLAPRNCNADLSGAYAFVVALDRGALPESPFTLKLNERSEPCPDCGFTQVIEVSVP